MTRQQNQIIEFIRANGSMTGNDAVYTLKMMDYRKRISELRQMGYDIPDIWEPHEGGKHKRYFLGGEPNG